MATPTQPFMTLPQALATSDNVAVDDNDFLLLVHDDLGENVTKRVKKQDLFGTTLQLSDGSSIVWDLNLKPSAKVVLGGNRTLNAPLNMKGGRIYSLIVMQDGVGSRTLTFPGTYLWPGGTDPVLSTTPNAVDVITFVCDGNVMYGSIQKGYA